MPNLAWIGEVVFMGAYFIAWCVGAFNPLTAPGAPHTFIVITAIAALVTAFGLLFYNGYPLVQHRNPPAA